MSKKNVIGRGLSAYLPDDNPSKKETSNPTVSPGKEQGIYMVDIDRVVRNENQPRQNFDKHAMNELIQSVTRYGVIQPITVHPIDNGKYEIISGERRWQASKSAKLKEIPAYIRETPDDERFTLSLIENIQREDLNPIEVAIAYEKLLTEQNLTQDQISQRVGKSRSAVTNMLRLLKLPDFVQVALRDNKISMGHARALLHLKEIKHIKIVLSNIIERNISVRDVESITKMYEKYEPSLLKPKSKNFDTMAKGMETNLRDKLETQVRIYAKSTGESGVIRIEYYSKSDLDRIYKLLNAKK